MDSVYLKTLVEVFQTGSFTKTAEKLCVTQSAVSRRIQFLESQYGCTLVDRSGPSLKPTSEGTLVMEKALKIMEIEKDLHLGLSRMVGNQPFAFISTPIFSLFYLPEILRKFLRSQPQLADLQFVTDSPENIMESMNQGLFDFAVIEHCQDFDLSEFEIIDLPGDEIIFAAIPALENLPDDARLEDLFKHTLLGRKTGSCSRSLLEKNLEQFGRSIADFSRVLVVDDLNTHIDLILRGDGIAFISNDLIKPLIDSGHMVEIRIPGFIHKRRRTMVFSPRATECQFIQAFADQIRGHFQDSNRKETSSLGVT